MMLKKMRMFSDYLPNKDPVGEACTATIVSTWVKRVTFKITT